jgi:CubicO group peptidase (beta-lactamase class C family)
MAIHRVPGLALAITLGDKVLFVTGYGTARDDQPVTPQAQFFVGSLSKSFTALAIMQLVEAGQIDLDTPVHTYLPEFALADPVHASHITIRHLLHQVSGLSDIGFPASRPPQSATIAEHVAELRAARPVAAPGTEFHYFDPNYAVLARIVEVVSEEPFAAYLHTHVFAPLGMLHSVSVVTTSEATHKADRLAQGHVVVFGCPIACAEMSGYLGGSGGVISTAADMAHYLIMQNNGGRFGDARLLSPQGVALMHTPPQHRSSSYAMGWFARTQDGRRIIEHNGILSAFYTEVFLLPDAGYGVALLYNVNSLPSSLLAFPQIKSGLMALLTHGQPGRGGLSVSLWGIIIGGLTLMSVWLATYRLLRLPRWVLQARTTPMWRLLLNIGVAFVPALVLLVLPSLIALISDRVFGYEQLYRSMPSVMIWLSLSAMLGAVNGTARLLLLARQPLGIA